jgi:mannitol-1-/sugar-/sorbitol-6-phosphatase
MKTITCQAVLFDMDGVLVDSRQTVVRVWSKWAIAHGFDPAMVVRAAHGRPSVDTVREFLPQADAHEEDRKVEQAECEDLDGVVAIPGAVKLVESLPSGRWTVVTSATRPLAEVRLRAAGFIIPETLITSNDIRRGKPDPEPYLKAAAQLGFAPEDCVVVEDSPAGIRAGKAARARVIALPTTSEVEELRKLGPDHIVQDCSQIAAEFNGKDLQLKITGDLIS